MVFNWGLNIDEFLCVTHYARRMGAIGPGPNFRENGLWNNEVISDALSRQSGV